MTGMKNRFFPRLISGLFIFLFAYAATEKILDYSNFSYQLGRFPFFPVFLNQTAWLIPLVEYLAIFLLLFPSLRLAGLYLASGLMVLFTVYLGGVILFAPKIPCSCGGILEQLSWGKHILFNLCWILLGLAGIVLEKKYQKRIS